VIIILGLDGLEYEYVIEFKCKNLMQKIFGKTDISDFKELRTIVLWSSFLTGKNLEDKILSLGKDFWKFKLNQEETFFNKFKKWKAIDVPGFNYKFENHRIEREALKKFFNKEISINEYDEIVFKNHKENKKEFFNALEKDYEIIMGYFNLADGIGHLSFGIKSKMRLIYEELESIVEKAKEISNNVLIISDHGMKAIGRFGDHNNYGFWSLSKEISLNNPKLTEFHKIIEKLND